ncbi:MAG: ATP-binding cassette domain-containing protein, partial [Sediminibacterium sp.]
LGPLDQLIPGHPGIGYLSQHFELRNNYRVEELLAYANQLSDSDANTLFELCRISHLVKRKVDQLSGGEKQRIALARLLVGSPKLLLLDEPFSNLDPIHKSLLKTVLQDIGERLQITCILTSHDPMDTLSWADEIIVMKSGQMVQQGSPFTMYHHPVNEYAAGLFGSYNLLNTAEMAALFPEMAGKGMVFIRPEAFMVSHTPNGAVQGKIKNIRFWGSYYEMEVQVAEINLIIKTMDPHFEISDIVYISSALLSF